MLLTFLGGTKTVSGSRFSVETGLARGRGAALGVVMIGLLANKLV